MNDNEQYYGTMEKELPGTLWVTKYFRPYLSGGKFKIITDHTPLQWIMSLKEPKSKLLRWRLRLEWSDYEIVYWKVQPDALFWVEIHKKEFFHFIDEFFESSSKQNIYDNNESRIVNLDDSSVIWDGNLSYGNFMELRNSQDINNVPNITEKKQLVQVP